MILLHSFLYQLVTLPVPIENFIDAYCISLFYHWVYATRVYHMSHALVQRNSIKLCWPLLRTLDFACRPYPQFVSESHDTLVLWCTLALLSSLVGHLEPNNRHFIMVHWMGGFPCVQWQDIYSHFGIRAVSWMPLALLVVSSHLSTIFITGYYSEGIFRVPLAFGTCERFTRSLVHEHVLRLISSK